MTPTRDRYVPPDEFAEAKRIYRRDSYWLAYARQRGMTADEAQRFLLRQRASLQRQREAEAQAFHGPQLWCCGGFHPIHTLPFTAPCCGHVWLWEGTESASTHSRFPRADYPTTAPPIPNLRAAVAHVRGCAASPTEPPMPGISRRRARCTCASWPPHGRGGECTQLSPPQSRGLYRERLTE